MDLTVSFGDFPGGPVAKNISCNAGDANVIPGLGYNIGENEGKPMSSFSWL